MFHVTSARLGRLTRRIHARLSVPGEYAVWHGWETRQVRPGTREYRDPRFRQLAAVRAAALPADPAARSWARDAIAGRTRALGAGTGPRESFGREG